MDQTLNFVSISQLPSRSADTEISSLVLKSRVTTLKNIKEISLQKKPNKSPKLQPAGLIRGSHHLSLVKNIRSKLVLFLSLVGTYWPPEMPSLPCLFHGKTQVTKLSESIQGAFAWNCLAQPQNLVDTGWCYLIPLTNIYLGSEV